MVCNRKAKKPAKRSELFLWASGPRGPLPLLPWQTHKYEFRPCTTRLSDGPGDASPGDHNGTDCAAPAAFSVLRRGFRWRRLGAAHVASAHRLRRGPTAGHPRHRPTQHGRRRAPHTARGCPKRRHPARAPQGARGLRTSKALLFPAEPRAILEARGRRWRE